MTDELKKLQNDLNLWQSQHLRVTTAIKERDYRNFYKTIRQSNKTFNRIQVALLSNIHKQAKQSLSDDLLRVAELWKNSNNAILKWKNELNDEFETLRKTRRKNTNLNDAYKQKRPQAGQHLNIRAL